MENQKFCVTLHCHKMLKIFSLISEQNVNSSVSFNLHLNKKELHGRIL